MSRDGFIWVRFPNCLVNVSLGIEYRILSTGSKFQLIVAAPGQVFQSQPHILCECPSHAEALALLNTLSQEVEAKEMT